MISQHTQHIVFLKVTLSLGLLSPPSPLFEWGLQRKEILFQSGYEMLKLSMQGSEVIIGVVQVGAVKIYVAPVEPLRKKERAGSKHDETQFTTKKKGSIFHFQYISWRLMYVLFLMQVLFIWISPGFGPNSGFWCCVCLTLPKTLTYAKFHTKYGNAITWNLGRHRSLTQGASRVNS